MSLGGGTWGIIPPQLFRVPLRLSVSEDCKKICLSEVSTLIEITRQLANDLGKAELRLASLQDKSANQRISESLIYLKSKYPQQIWTRKESVSFEAKPTIT